MKWEPIDTAPKDGGYLLMIDSEKEFQAVAYWHETGQMWCYGSGYTDVILKPTHWMPLLPPPGE